MAESEQREDNVLDFLVLVLGVEVNQRVRHHDHVDVPDDIEHHDIDEHQRENNHVGERVSRKVPPVEESSCLLIIVIVRGARSKREGLTPGGDGRRLDDNELRADL